MKQHIYYLRVEKELSKKAAKKLRDWAVKKGYQNQLYWANYMPSIGQMIEFMRDEGDSEWIKIRLDEFGPCDALWHAVKEVLNDNK